jgi:hypothetical protein
MMCVLTIKPDEILNCHQAKSRIVVLGNHGDCLWSKLDTYAPVLCPDTLRLILSMAIEQWKVLQQGDCKNAFCQGILPPDEIKIVKPPIVDPDAKTDEYWLLKWATNMGYQLIVNTCNLFLDLSSKDYPITDAESATPVFNDNKTCVQ